MKIGIKLRQELLLDIGSSHTVVASLRHNRLIRVPSRIALSGGSAGRPAGAAASRNVKKEQQGATLVFPVEGGRVIDVYAMEQLLKELLQQSGGKLSFLALRNVALPLVRPGLAEQEQARLRAMLVDVGFSRINTIEAPFAAARGCGFKSEEPGGRMVIDLGGGKMDCALFSMGGLVAWHQEPLGGKRLDQAIFNHITGSYNVVMPIGTAEKIKLAIGALHPKDKPESFLLRAPEKRTDIPKKINLDDNEIRDVLVDACEPMIRAIQQFFEEVPPELAGDIVTSGVTLIGGGALMPGLPQYLRERTGLKFQLAEDPYNAMVNGAKELMRDSGG